MNYIKYLSLTIICILLFSTIAIAHGGKKKMQPLYDIQEAQSLKPQELKLNGGLFGTGIMSGRQSSISLFPVPQDNAVGTNDMNNAITLISFPKGRISFDKHFKNAVEDIGGGGVYLPVVSKDIIAFGQVRRFMIYDFKKKTHRKFRITMSIAKTIEKAAIADAYQQHFLFEVEGQDTRSSDHWAISNTLQLMNLSDEEAKLIREIPVGKGVAWSVVGDKNFLFDIDKKQVKVFNMKLEPAHHPLADIINRSKGKISFIQTHPHPFLPFAILSGGDEGSTYVNWGPNRETKPFPLIDCTTQFSFSPDGKWVTFQKDFPEPKMTYLMPVSEKYPNFLGSPILLLNDFFNDNKTAWTTNPISFVGSKLENIFRWDLDNQDFPEKGTMSYHDYVVQEDLKKLTREKKQGLGKK